MTRNAVFAVVVGVVVFSWHVDWVIASPSHRATSDAYQRSSSWQAIASWRGGATSSADVQPVIHDYPDWFTPMEPNTIQPFLALAQQRHDQAVQKARENYYHFDPCNHHDDQHNDHHHLIEDHDKTILASLSLDEYDIESTQRLPDFHDQLPSTIFVTRTPLFTPDECRAVIDMAEDHFAINHHHEWTRLPSGQYQVAGFWIRHVPSVHAWLNRMVQHRLFPLLAQQFPHFVSSPHDLVVDNAYLFKYTPETGRRTDVHTDSGCLSFTIALNQRNDDYQGGGTWFEGLQQTPRTKLDDGDDDNDQQSVLEMNVGQVTIRPGGVRHCGHAVTQGVRYIIGGFCMRVDKVEPVRQLLGLASELLQQQQEETTNPDWKRIERLLHAALTLNPYFDGIYTHLARLYQKRRQPEKARQVLEHCHAHVNPKSGEVAYSLGLLCLEQGDYDQVQSCMRVCLEADANDIDAMALMAQAILQRRLQQRESSDASSSLQMKPASDEKEDAGDEETWYRRIVQNPSATPTQLASAFCNLGVLHEGREDEVQLYQTSLEHDSSNFATWYSLACALAAQQHHEPAARAFRQALARIGDEDTKERHQRQVLHALYRSAVAQLRQQPPNRFSSQQETIEELKRIMGEDNYHLLAAMTR